MALWIIIAGASLLVLISIVLLVQKKRRVKAARRQASHAESQLAIFNLNGLYENDGADVINQHRNVVEGAWQHAHECSTCAIERTEALSRSSTMLRSIDLTGRLAKMQKEDDRQSVGTIMGILQDTNRNDSWYKSTPYSREQLEELLAERVKKWIATISRLTDENAERTKRTIDKCRSLTAYTTHPVRFPAHWNDMVANGVERPALELFVNVPELSFRSWIHKYREALEAEDLTSMKVLYAIAVDGRTIDTDDLLYYLTVEPVEPDRKVDVLSPVVLLNK